MGPVEEYEEGLDDVCMDWEYDLHWVEEEFEGAVSAERAEHLPNYWSEKMKEYWCARVSLSRIGEVSLDDEPEITAWDF